MKKLVVVAICMLVLLGYLAVRDLQKRGIDSPAMYLKLGDGGSIHAGAIKNDVNLIRRGVDAGESVDATMTSRAFHDLSGSTALMAACVCQGEDAVRELLRLGARVDVVDNNGSTPLAHAIQNYDMSDRSKNIIMMIIAAGADVDRAKKLSEEVNDWLTAEDLCRRRGLDCPWK